MSVQDDLRLFVEQSREIYDLQRVASLLSWDQSAYLPEKAAEGRGRQLALMDRLAHERFTASSFGDLVARLVEKVDEIEDPLLVDALRVTHRDYQSTARVSADFVSRRGAHVAKIYTAWTKARANNDFAAVAPLLEKSLEMSREYGAFFPEFEDPMDALIAEFDFGIRATEVRALFADLRKALVPLVEAVGERPAPDMSPVHQFFPKAQQVAFGEKVSRAIGYDFSRGRQDFAPHPFMIRLGEQDVRITTRVKEEDFTEAFFSTIHEVGHALYEQGIDPRLTLAGLGKGASSGIHESQSRLWENLVGRSRPFWRHFFPHLQKAFPSQLGQVGLEDFYRSINRVERSLIRTDADELTYNLHVMIRFELEVQLIKGELAVQDLSEAWHAAYRQALGICAPDDRDGVLQDVHWYCALPGGFFQGYTLGNIMSGQIYDAAKRANPTLEADMERGEFAGLLEWLRANVHHVGRRQTAAEILEDATGGPLKLDSYVNYLTTKYSDLYGL